MENKKYCSLDIETSGFDPVKDEILEIGFAFFEIGKSDKSDESEVGSRIKITNEYSKVFKPEREVSETILALTGITNEELKGAPKFSEHLEEIQNKLKDAVLVGHNIGFDIKFLQGLGVKFSGTSIDTLDLVQFILPTHPSYNLENLMHYFGVPHIEAHRALADAKASLKVLAGLIETFSGFPLKLKQEIITLLKPSNLAFKDVLGIGIKGLSLKPNTNKAKPITLAHLIELKDKTFYNFPLGIDIASVLAKNLEKSKTKNLLVVPNTKLVLDLQRMGLCQGAFASEQLFKTEAFNALKDKPILSADELKFVLKILVWQNTNWQTENISDLNLSFFGGQFRHLIVGETPKENKTSKFIACDLEAFLEFKAKGWYKNRKAVFLGLADLEKALSGNIGEKLSWSRASFLLKTAYNPETGLGNIKFKKAVEEGLSSCDLFFGLVSAFLQIDPPGFLQIKPEEIEENILNKIRAAAENFAVKLALINKQIASDEIEDFSRRLNKFFIPEKNTVKWLELSPRSCVFHSSPINIQNLSVEILQYDRETIFCDCLPLKLSWQYFQNRLGLVKYKMEAMEFPPKKPKDLFSFLGAKIAKIKLEIKPVNLSDEDLIKFCNKDYLPAALILSSSLQVKTFYHQYHEALQKTAFVLAQSGSAGGSRILRNFSIHKESLLLASDKFILKSLIGKGAGAFLRSLPVKTLVLGHLPFEQFKHPYLEAVSRQFTDPFEDFSLPRALINLHQIIKFFYTPALKQVLVADIKLNKPYSKVFLEYLNALWAPH